MNISSPPSYLSSDQFGAWQIYLERLTRRYTSEIGFMIGPDKDIPAPDVNTNERIMAWMMDTYSMNAGHTATGAVTGKPLSLGGSLGRRGARDAACSSSRPKPRSNAILRSHRPAAQSRDSATSATPRRVCFTGMTEVWPLRNFSALIIGAMHDSYRAAASARGMIWTGCIATLCSLLKAKNMKILGTWAFAILIALPACALAADKSLGQLEYESKCVMCHGAAGKGDGWFSGHLKSGMPSLTRLKRNNGGMFPFDSVYQVIDGRKEVLVHGPRQMPSGGAWNGAPLGASQADSAYAQSARDPRAE